MQMDALMFNVPDAPSEAWDAALMEFARTTGADLHAAFLMNGKKGGGVRKRLDLISQSTQF